MVGIASGVTGVVDVDNGAAAVLDPKRPEPAGSEGNASLGATVEVVEAVDASAVSTAGLVGGVAMKRLPKMPGAEAED